MQRTIKEIAQEIRKVWPTVNRHAEPYLDAMHSLETATDYYGADDAETVVIYFLANATYWRGPDARRIKKELKDLFAKERL